MRHGDAGVFRSRGIPPTARDCARDDGVVRWRLNVIAALAILPIAAGCSSSPPWSSSANPPANQTAAVPPPPNYPATTAGQPAYAPPPGQQTYAPPPGQQAYAPAAQSPPPEQNTVGSFRQSYAGFLQMFRDPPEQDPAAQNARPSPPPGSRLTRRARQTPIRRRSNLTLSRKVSRHFAAAGAADFASAGATGLRAAGAAELRAAIRPTELRRAANKASLCRAGGNRRGGAASRAAGLSNSLPYPKQSLVDAFRGSTQTPAQGQTQGANQGATQGTISSRYPGSTRIVPHPPSTYTPSGQPYSPPPGQPANSAPPPAATAAAAPPPIPIHPLAPLSKAIVV